MRKNKSAPWRFLLPGENGLVGFYPTANSRVPHIGMAFVLVQHLDPTHESALTKLLARTTSIPVREVTDKLFLR